MVMRTVPIIWYTSPRWMPWATLRPAIRPARLAEMPLLSVGAGILGCWIVLRGLAFYSTRSAAPPSPAWCSRTASASPPRSGHLEPPPPLAF